MGDARPYIEASSEAVRAGGWRLVTDENEEPLPEWIPSWDMSQTLSLRRQIDIDIDRVFAETRLPPDSQLAVSVSYTSEFEDEACWLTIDETGGVVPLELDIELDGSLLGSSVTLSTSLVLSETTTQASGRIAWRRGSILWQDSKKVRLYGDSSQFPLMEADFSDLHLDPQAPWFVQVGPDLGLPAMGAILLLLNSRFPLVIEAATQFTADRAELRVVRSALYEDVARTLVETGLSCDDLGEEWPEDSLGDVLATLIESRFNEPLHELRTLRDQEPAMWDALVAARFGLLREPLR
jgi:hypothetical protein